MRKQSLFVIVATMLASMPLFAQSSNNVDDVVKIDHQVASDYRQGEMIVKFKPTSDVRVRALGRSFTSGVNRVDKVMGEIGITASEQLMPLSGAVVESRAKALRSVSGNTIEDSDMSQLYRLSFDASNVNVHEAVEKLSALDEVEFAEPNYVVYALSSGEVTAADKGDDPLKSEQWGHGQLKLDFLKKQKPITDKRPVIAILDTGVDITHPDLADNIWTNEAEANGAEGEDDDANGFKDDLHGWDFVNQTARLGDWNGHGTHCAGIAAAVGDNKIGITGANPDALIMPITVMQSDGTGDVATIIKGIDYAAANGADVISMSIGGYGYSLAEEQALAKAYNTAVLVAAAGNDFKCIYAHDCPVNKKNAMQNGPMFPAAFTFVLGVEASTQDGGLASFSNFDEDGPVFSQYSEDKLYNYELRAPGAQITSTFPGGKYKALSGTSMACPYVAGGISRLLQVKEYGNWEILFGDLIHARKHRCEHEHDENVDFEAVYKITDKDRTPTLSLVTYTLNDTEGGDGDGKPDAGETIEFYPTLRNEWGQAKNIRFSLALAEAEDPTIVEFLEEEVEFGKELSSYGKNVSATPIRFKVNPDCADGRKICMVFRATCDNITEELEYEFTLSAENGVEIGGMIMENTTLYPDVHYIVTRTISVPEGITLTILPGTVLKFRENAGFNSSSSTIVCKGTPDRPIVFMGCESNTGMVGFFKFGSKNVLEYVCFENLSFPTTTTSVGAFQSLTLRNGRFYNIKVGNTNYYSTLVSYGNLTRCNIYNCRFSAALYASSGSFVTTNLIGNILRNISGGNPEVFANSNSFGNVTWDENAGPYNISYDVDNVSIFTPSEPNYFGSTKENIVSQGVYDLNHITNSTGSGVYNLKNMLTRPVAEAHGIVWKVVVNGYDAQDEFEQLPPLGVGKHKFDVYFNRPMDKSFIPMITMGVRPPYTSHSIAENGSWNEEGTVYTAYLTIDGKTGADGLNRIYVADAVESFEDYYLRQELQSVKPRTENLFRKVTNIPGKVVLQVSNPVGAGYFTCLGKASNESSKLFNGNLNDDIEIPDYIMVDLGVSNSSRFIRFNYHTCVSYYPKEIKVQGSNDGIEFDDIRTLSTTDVVNPLPKGSRVSWASAYIDACSPYRYYRFVMPGTPRIAEFGMEVLDPIVKEDYIHSLSNEESLELQANILLANNLCAEENRDASLLQSVMDQMYVDYNKLASILQQPLIEQEPVEVPSSAPAWVIPVENTRFNVQVAAAGSMATGLMAEAGLGKVTLTWETDEEDFADLLGYNLYRYTMNNGVSSDSIIVNPSVINSEETSFVDYDVIPGTTYYYLIKQLTTSLTSHALSNAVAATPLTAQKGDANGSMSVDIADVVTEVAYITYQNPQPFIFEAADVNSDEEINVLDVVGTLGIIINPEGIGVSGMDNEPVRYYVQDGVLYVENTQPLGGVQIHLNVAKGTEITALEALTGMEQTSVWTSDEEYLFLAYSMSGKTIPAGTHALLQIGNEAVVTKMIASDSKGHNIAVVDNNATGIGKVEAMQLQMPAPNPFTTVLNVPYTIGKSGSHEVIITFNDMAGRTIDAYHAVKTQGKYTYTWYPKALQKGLYLVSLYVDGELMQTVKVICNN